MEREWEEAVSSLPFSGVVEDPGRSSSPDIGQVLQSFYLEFREVTVYMH